MQKLQTAYLRYVKERIGALISKPTYYYKCLTFLSYPLIRIGILIIIPWNFLHQSFGCWQIAFVRVISVRKYTNIVPNIGIVK